MSLRAALEGDRDRSLAALDAASALRVDAEALFYLARTYAYLGNHDRAAAELARVVDGGFWCHETFARDPWLEAIRARDDVRGQITQARERSEQARAAFMEAGGPRLVSTTSRTTSRDA